MLDIGKLAPSTAASELARPANSGNGAPHLVPNYATIVQLEGHEIGIGARKEEVQRPFAGLREDMAIPPTTTLKQIAETPRNLGGTRPANVAVSGIAGFRGTGTLWTT